MSAITTTSARTGASRGKLRLVAVTVAAGAALAVWGGAELLGTNVLAPGFADQAPRDIEAANVALTASAASLAGWALLILLERLTEHARTIWTTTAVLVFLVSLGGPMSGTGLTPGHRAVLLLMHVAVAAVLIPAMYRTTPTPDSASSASPR